MIPSGIVLLVGTVPFLVHGRSAGFFRVDWSRAAGPCLSHAKRNATITTSAPHGELDASLARWLDSQLAIPENELPPYDTLLDRIEASMLRHLLERHDQRPTRLAAALRIHRATLRQKLRRLGLQGEEG